MHFYTNNLLAELAARARTGDWAAKERFRRELAVALTDLAQETLQRGFGDAPLARCILAEARRLRPFEDLAGAGPEQDDFVREVAQNVCDAILSRMLRAPSRRYGAANTYCDYADDDSCVAV